MESSTTRFIIQIAIFIVCVAASSLSRALDIAWYYGSEVPTVELQLFDAVVLQPHRVTTQEIATLNKRNIKPLAYFNLGEVTNLPELYGRLAKNAYLARKNNDSIKILDWRVEQVRQQLIASIQQLIVDRGYQGVYLDKLDAFLDTKFGVSQSERFLLDLESLINDIREILPDGLILVAPGKNDLSYLESTVDGFVFQSLYREYYPESEVYAKVDDSVREQRIQQIKQLQSVTERPVFVIDFVSPRQKSLAESVARKIRDLGVTPWVTDGRLFGLGQGNTRVIPRKIVGITDTRDPHIYESQLLRYLATPLEYLGFQFDYLHLPKQSLPEGVLNGRYSGVVVWLENSDVDNSDVCHWLARQSRNNIPVVFFGVIPEHHACENVAGIDQRLAAFGNQKVLRIDNETLGNFEGKLALSNSYRINVRNTSTDNDVWLTLEDDNQQQFHPIVTGATGGYALYPFIHQHVVDNFYLWLFDPFLFLKTALQLPDIPVPDVTTESGQRILTAHIDGDAIVSRAELPGTPLAGDVVKREILERYDLPHTVSIVEGETSPDGVYPKFSAAAEQLSREMFAMNNVEVATHSFSHPFFWVEAERQLEQKNSLYGTHLPIKDYEFSLEREIYGSIDYINKKLTKENKNVKVFLWTGDGSPSKKAVCMTQEAGVLNVNGGNTYPVKHSNSLTRVTPIGIDYGDCQQIYAPVMNENVYTNDWTGPFYGYRNAIDSFNLLEKPRRLKPISIYYHFYSGSKASSLNALKQIYDWAVAQESIPLYLSDYALRARTLYRTAVGKKLDGAFVMRHDGVLNTFRLPTPANIDFELSDNVIGYRDINDSRYIQTVGNSVELRLSDMQNTRPYIKHANAVFEAFEKVGEADIWQAQVSLSSEKGIRLVIGNATSCTLQANGNKPIASRVVKKNEVLIRSQRKRMEDAVLECR